MTCRHSSSRAVRPLVVLLIGLVLSPSTGQARTPGTPPAGLVPTARTGTPGASLVIVGGGLQDDNADVYRAFLQRAQADRPIVVLPTASGVPEESGALTRSRLLAHDAPDDTEVLMITTDQPAEGEDDEAQRLARRLESAGAVWFTGGKQSRIIAQFPRKPEASAFRDALDRAVANGAAVGGTSAGAAVMSDPMIIGGRSRDAVAHGVRTDAEQRGVGLAEGLGLFTTGIVDQHFLARGRLGRLIVALEHTGAAFGFGIAENGALVTDDSGRSCEVIGDPGVVLVDMRNATRDGDTRRGVRISLLCTGDVIRGSVVIAAGDALENERPGANKHREDDPWARHAVTRMLRAVAEGRDAIAGPTDGGQTLRLSGDERTRVYQRGAHGTPTVVDALLELTTSAP